jgi:CHC2 zinc finger
MQRLEAGGYQIVLHVHDEIVCEIPEGFGSAVEFHALMTQLPSWASELPIAAKVWTSPRYYVKDKDAIAPRPESAPDLDEDGKTSPISVAPTAVIAPEPTEDGDGNGPDGVNIPLAGIIGEPLVGGMVSCPFHDDRTPSCRICEDHFHCFGCGARGNHLDG